MSKVTIYLRAQDRLSDIVGKGASWITAVLIGILIYEIAMRYILNAPTIWAHELSTMLFGALGILAGTYTLRYRAHVRSDVVYMLFRPKLKAFCDTVVYLLGFVALAIFLQMSWEFALQSWNVREVSSKSSWQPVLYPIKLVIPLGVGLLILQNVAELVRAVLTLLGVDFEDPRETAAEIDLPQPPQQQMLV